MVKFVGCARRKAGMTVAEFQDYWKNNHGPLVKSVPEFWQYVRKYVQGHTLTVPVPGFPPSDYEPFDGIAELWFDSVEDIGKAFTHPRYLEIIRPDEAKLVDFANSRMFIVEDVEIG